MTASQRMFAAWYDRAMARYETYIAQRKQRLFADLSGTVLEIGPGTGANLPHLPRGCRWIGVEPNPHMRAPLSQRLDRLDLEAEIQPVAAEDLQTPDGSIDAVIATLTLCSVRRPQRVLSEIRRVLRPGGQFCYIEHLAAAQGSWARRGQQLVAPLWSWLGDGCRLDRETDAAIQAGGFTAVEMDHFRVPRFVLPRVVALQVSGTAIR